MKVTMLLLLLSATGVALASEPEAKPAPRPRLTEALRQRAMAISPSAHANVASEASGGRGEGSNATGPYPVIGADHGMVGRINGPSPLSRPFDLREGGTYQRMDGGALTLELMLQFDAPNAGWDLLRLSW